MSTDKSQDGGPAFPSEPKRFEIGNDGFPHPMPNHYSGMSLRDYFAGQVAPCFIAEMLDADSVAAAAYRYADAMLKARGTQ